MHFATVSEAQSLSTDGYRYWLHHWVQPGDTVAIGQEWTATITEQGRRCDCGKGVLCPLNPQTRTIRSDTNAGREDEE